jgi:hypothetical protein
LRCDATRVVSAQMISGRGTLHCSKFAKMLRPVPNAPPAFAMACDANALQLGLRSTLRSVRRSPVSAQ